MFDYKYLERCQYEIDGGGDSPYAYECNEPAVAIVWWNDSGFDRMYVCQKHLDYIKKCEEK